VRSPPTSSLFPYTTLFRSRVRQPFQGKLGRHVGPGERRGPEALDRSHVDDAAVAAAQERQERLDGRDLPDHVDLELPAKLAEGRSEEHTSELQSPDHIVCR